MPAHARIKAHAAAGFEGDGAAPKQQQGWRRHLNSPYDGELFALAIPALAAMLLDPLGNIVDAGARRSAASLCAAATCSAWAEGSCYRVGRRGAGCSMRRADGRLHPPTRPPPMRPTLPTCLAAMVGHVGTQQLGALSLGSLCASFATFMFSFLLVLTTPRVAAAMATGDKERVRGAGRPVFGGQGPSRRAAGVLHRPPPAPLHAI